MKTLYALAAAGLLAFSVPALAQNAGTAGASGASNGLSGSNPGTGPATSNTDSNKLGGEGRAAAPDTTTTTGATNQTNTPQKAGNPAPTTVRGDQNGQGGAKQ